MVKRVASTPEGSSPLCGPGREVGREVGGKLLGVEQGLRTTKSGSTSRGIRPPGRRVQGVVSLWYHPPGREVGREVGGEVLGLAEDMQVLHYSKTQHYWAHHDYFDPNIYRGFVTAPGQNRFITVLFYLSDIEKGGETVFPFAGDNRPVTDFSDCSRGVKVTPKAGDAVMFYSMTARRHMDVCPPDDLGCNLDIKSLHGSCDVVTGEKWAANYWVSNKV
eukprot:CAMPEP_0180331234 /NCGR_PEP_ID=MMETSP0988-20121125/41806_1 /TAXON_ID=697907 /ORGANISM="non described non described, Strain CCMP2293" /LENGTH=218 /DNA_ID=CAMNT_0022318631 /DNA_START=133 /DNA_END=789 /DNA_ORIENTATION=+